MNQKILIGFVVVLVAVIAGIFGWRYVQFRNEGKPTATAPRHILKEKKIESKLDGTQVAESAAARRPTAIVVENHPEARPQVGLDQASVMYEAIAEGGITRMLAIFGPQLPEKVGPVRSARTFFVNWALDWDALFGHVGGSKDGLELVRTSGVADLDQFTIGARAYYREEKVGVAIEHTMFANPAKLYEAAKDFKNYSITDGNFTPWIFKADATQAGSGQVVSIDFSQPQYKVTWAYDQSNNSYSRNLGGTAHKDGISGKQISAKNVVVMDVSRHSKDFGDAKSVFEFDLTGSGKARIFQDGKQIDGTWKRTGPGKRQVFTDSSGNEIKMNRGATWIEIANPDSVKVEVKPLETASTPKP